MALREPDGTGRVDARAAGLRPNGLIISPYQSSWPKAFQDEAARLLTAAEPWIYRAEHVGSTSVPGLCAKPVIDILLAATSLADVDRHGVKRLLASGYIYVEAYNEQMPFRRFFLRDDRHGQRTHHLHVVCESSAFWREHVLFRDYLRTHPDDARDYGELKKSLAPRFHDANAYGQAKSAFIERCMAAARSWDAAGRQTAAP